MRLLAWFCVAWAIFGAITTAPPPLHPEIKAADSREGTYRNHNTAEVQAIRTDLGTRCNTVQTWGLYLGTRYSASRCTWAAVHGAHLHRVKRGSWQASTGVLDGGKKYKRSKLRAPAPSMSYLGGWRLGRAQGELVASQYAQIISFLLLRTHHSVVRAEAWWRGPLGWASFSNRPQIHPGNNQKTRMFARCWPCSPGWA